MLDTLNQNIKELEALFSLPAQTSSLSKAQLKEIAQLVDEKTLYSADGWLHLYYDLTQQEDLPSSEINWKSRKKISLLIETLQNIDLTPEQKQKVEPALRFLTQRFHHFLKASRT